MPHLQPSPMVIQCSQASLSTAEQRMQQRCMEPCCCCQDPSYKPDISACLDNLKL